MPLQAEERLFIEAMRDLNQQASRMQEEEKEGLQTNGVVEAHPTAPPSHGSRSSDDDDSNHDNNQFVGTNQQDVNSTGTAVTMPMSTAALVHAATNTLADAASKLNNKPNDASPTLDSITSWTKIPSKTVDTGGLSTIEGMMGNKKRTFFSTGFK